MFKLFKDTFKSTNEGIILATPLILFLWLITLYISYSKEVVDTLPEMILSGITMLFMFSAFCSGWFYMVKKCVEFSKKDFILDEDKAHESLKLIQALPIGIGKYFLKYVGVCVMFLGMAMLMASITYSITIPFIQQMDFSLEQMSTAINSAQEAANFISTMPTDKMLILFKLNMILLGITSLFSFLLMLWMPEIIYTDRNPLVALFTSIKKLFIKFWKSIGLFVYITMCQFVISYLSTFALLHPLAYMIMMIIYFYFIVYIVVLIFSYYDREFNNNDEQTENSGDSRSDG